VRCFEVVREVCSMLIRRSCTLAPFCAVAVLAATATAQSVTITAIGANVATEEIGRLYGVRLGAVLPTPAPGITVRLSLETASANRAVVGPLCVGLILNPAECNPRAYRRTSTAAGVMGGVGFKVVSTPRTALNLNFGIGVLREKTQARLSSGISALADDQGIWRAELGLDAHWFPFRRLPLGVVIESAYGTQKQIVDQGIVDGYSPLVHSAQVTQLRVGAIWRVPKKSARED
jgi:hypothetical protein